MRFSFAYATLLFAATAFAVPNASQPANIGYATLNGGTSGGIGGASTTVSSLAALRTAVADDTKRIVWVSGTITGEEVIKVGSNKSILGLSGATLQGVGLRVLDKQNIIIRNLKITKVLAAVGDAIGIQGPTVSNIWVDHVDLASDRDHDKDYYDGLLDVTHGARFITFSYSYLHEHWKGSLVGHSDSNTAEDQYITITYANNLWKGVNSRFPSFRAGTGHIFNSYYEGCSEGIISRVGAQLLVENNIFTQCAEPIAAIYGYVVARNNDLGGGVNTAPLGSLTVVPYPYTLIPLSILKAHLDANAGAKL